MNPDYPSSDETDPIARAAAEWVLRHDRGLTATEQDAFSLWLAADPRHSAAWAEHRWGWEEFDRLAGLQTSIHAEPDPELLARHRWTRTRLLPRALALAAVLALGAFVWLSRPVPAPVLPASPNVIALIEQRELPDGSTIELNRTAVVTEHFTAGERRVRLERGEANFKVAKDAARPFFVEAGGVVVRAVGTEFNVRLDPSSVEVLVTEGKVAVASPAAASASPAPRSRGDTAVHATFLTAGERTVVSLAPAAPAPQVATIAPAEIEARLAWQPRLLDFNASPLGEIVAEFNRRNPVRLTLAGAGLEEMRLSATFRSDNIEGFVRLMESDFGMRAERRRDDEIVLSR